jgi:hypothetical protein
MLLGDVWRDAWRVPDRRPIHEWAADGNVFLPSVFTINGGFNVQLSRHLIEPFEALHDDQVRSVTVVAPPRSGKSMLSDVLLPSIVRRDPGPVGVFMQSDPIAEAHFRTRILPILRECPGIKEMFPQRFKWREVIFSNGMPLYVSGPSIGNLQARGIRYLICDEVWIWPEGRLREAQARTRDYDKIGTSKKLIISQGGYVDDALDQEFKAGDGREWMVHCFKCGKYQLPKWTANREDGSRWGIVYDTPKLGRDDRRALSELRGQILPTLRFECQHCGHGHPVDQCERTQTEWNRLGKYEAQFDHTKSAEKIAESQERPSPRPSPQGEGERKPAKGEAKPAKGSKSKEQEQGEESQAKACTTNAKVSFHYPGIITRSWVEMATDFLAAMDAYKRGAIEPLQTFFQKDLAESWGIDRTLQADPMTQEKFDVSVKWESEYVKLFTMDVQETHYWGLVHAWAKNGDTRRLWYGRLYSEAELKAKQAEFGVKSHHCLIDSGEGRSAREIYAMCCRNGWIALKGEDEEYFLHNVARAGEKPNYVRRSTSVPSKGDPEMGTAAQGARFAHLIRWSNPAIKERLKRIIDGRGSKWIIPAGGDAKAEEEYRTQMRAEYKKLTINPTTGRRTYVWVCPSGNNHAFDCSCEQVVGATLLKILPDDVTGGDSRGDRDA